MEHHKYGFSKWPALKECPLFESNGTTSAASTAGTENHKDFTDAVLALKEGLPATSNNDDAKWAAQECYSLCGTTNIECEQYVVVPKSCTWAAGVFGTCDALAVANDGTLHVFDYKSGARTDIDYMYQVAGYAYAICSSGCIDGKIMCHILYGASREVITHEFRMEELTSIAENIMKSIVRCSGPHCNACCKYCAHSMECTACGGAMVAFSENKLTALGDASLYSILTSMKAVIESKLDELKSVAKDKGFLDDGNMRYELRTDKHGKAKSVDVAELWWDAKDLIASQEDMLSACSISKKAFVNLCLNIAEERGMTKKELEEMYDARCTFGEPASRLIKVNAKED